MDSNHLSENSRSFGPTEEGSEGLAASVGKKRPAEKGELGVSSGKKARSGGGLVLNVKKVAETVLMLAAMGKMRGGRSPTAVEKEMMAEAREKLTAVCEDFAPKDVFPRDAFGAVIEDLGLNRLREQKLGFRPPKMSIAEKLLLTKQKMEKSQEFSSRTATHSSQRLPTNVGATSESHVASHTNKMFPLDKPSHVPISSGGFKPAAPSGHVSVTNSTSLPYQLPTSEVRTSMVSSGLPTGLLGKDSSSSALPRVDGPHFRLDPKSNGSSYASHIQVNSSRDHTLLKTIALFEQSQSSLLGTVLPHPSVKVEGIANVTLSRVVPQVATSKPLIAQSMSRHPATMHHHVQGMNFVQAPLLSNAHNEIGKIVHKLLQPQLPEHPTWAPPSRDYLNKALTCQVCKLTINEVENVLVCDSCEKGYHLKCLQSYSQKGVPKGEWHCVKCLSLSNSKPLPPKYGRVTRNKTTLKIPSNAGAVQSFPEKKAGQLGERGNQEKKVANGSCGLQSATAGSMGNNHNHSAPGSNMPKEMQWNGILLGSEKMDNKLLSETCPNNISRTSGPACVSSSAGSIERSNEEKLVSKLEGQPPAKPLDTDSRMLDHLQASSLSNDNVHKRLPKSAGISSMQYHENNLAANISEKSHSSKTFDGNQKDDTKQMEQRVVRVEPVEISGTSIPANEYARSSSDGSSNVDWIGDVLQVVDEMTYYRSCCINGVTYTVQDHVLYRFNKDKLMPSKLQTMWEDNRTRSKWVIVNRCYFPGDLPEAAGRPCSPEINEVYESTCGSTIMAGLIHGPCVVLPPSKFIEESKRRSCLGTGANYGSQPLFLCNIWSS